MAKNPYRVAFTAEEVKKFKISPNAIRGGFRGVPHWPPLSTEQQKKLDLRIAMTMWVGIIKLDLQTSPSITDQALLEKYYEQGFDKDFVRQAILKARQESEKPPG